MKKAKKCKHEIASNGLVGHAKHCFVCGKDLPQAKYFGQGHAIYMAMRRGA